MIAYETTTSIEMVEKIKIYQNLNGKYEIDFNKTLYKQYDEKEQAQVDYNELRKLFYSEKLNIIKG